MVKNSSKLDAVMAKNLRRSNKLFDELEISKIANFFKREMNEIVKEAIKKDYKLDDLNLQKQNFLKSSILDGLAVKLATHLG